MAKKVKYITRGAVMICENGSKKVLLDIPEGHGVYIGVQPNAMRFDCKPGENVKGFGKCSAADYHKSSKVTGIDKALSFGILDIGQDCVLDLLPEWFICDENQIITPEYEEGKANPVPKKMSVQNMEEFSEVLKARDAFNDVDSRSWISRVGDAIGGNNILSYDEVQTLESQISSAKGNASNPDEEKYLLTMDSVLVCRCGGVIKFETSGQEYSDEDFDVIVTLQDKEIRKTPEQVEQEENEKKQKIIDGLKEIYGNDLTIDDFDNVWGSPEAIAQTRYKAEKNNKNLDITDEERVSSQTSLDKIKAIMTDIQEHTNDWYKDFPYYTDKQFDLTQDDDVLLMRFLSRDEYPLTDAQRNATKTSFEQLTTRPNQPNSPFADDENFNFTSRFNDQNYSPAIDTHTGSDLITSDGIGTAIYATTGGIVISTDTRITRNTWLEQLPSYGISVKIKGYDGQTYIYGHLSSYDVEVGNLVLPGTKIAELGNTGYSSGPHLHYEQRNSTNVPVTPELPEP